MKKLSKKTSFSIVGLVLVSIAAIFSSRLGNLWFPWHSSKDIRPLSLDTITTVEGAFGISSPDGSVMFYCNNLGDVKNTVGAALHVSSNPLYCITFSTAGCDSVVGIVAGASGSIFRSTNKGLDWAAPVTIHGSIQPDQNIYAVKFLNCDTVLLVGGKPGANGFAMISGDRGLNWYPIAVPSQVTDALYTIGIPHSGAPPYWIAGGNGIVFSSNSIMPTWTPPVQLVSGVNIRGCDFKDALNGIAVLENGAVYTIDATGNWVAQSPPGASKLFACLLTGKPSPTGLDWVIGTSTSSDEGIYTSVPPISSSGWSTVSLSNPTSLPSSIEWRCIYSPNDGDKVYFGGKGGIYSLP